MPTLEPLRKYLEGIEEYKRGNEEEALKLIASSIGADKPTPMMRNGLKQITKPNIAILTLILHQSRGD